MYLFKNNFKITLFCNEEEDTRQEKSHHKIMKPRDSVINSFFPERVE